MTTAARTPKSYKLEEIRGVLESMIEAAQTYNQDRKGELADEHPWAMIYMGFFPESEVFLRLAANHDHKLEVVEVPNEEIERRVKNKEAAVIRYQLSAPNDSSIVFGFIADNNGNFIFE